MDKLFDQAGCASCSDKAVVNAGFTQLKFYCCPILLLAEVGRAISRRLESAEFGEKAVNRLLSIPTLHLVAMDHTLGMNTSQTAARYRLRGADAYYVAAAAQLNALLVSWDQEHIERTNGFSTAYTPDIEK